MKPLTYEQWKEKFELGGLPLRGVFDAAREGMVPSPTLVPMVEYIGKSVWRVGPVDGNTKFWKFEDDKWTEVIP